MHNLLPSNLNIFIYKCMYDPRQIATRGISFYCSHPPHSLRPTPERNLRAF